jgi:hypothetical protein
MTMPNTQGGSTSGTGAISDPVSQTTTGAGSAGTGGARGQIRQMKEQVVDQARNTFRDARDKATSSLGEGRRQAADQIGGIASAFHSASEHLRDENQERIAGLADSLAGQVDQVANYLRDADFNRLARDLEGLARRQPALIFGAAFALGVIGARFLKSSDRRTEIAGSRRFAYEYDEYDDEYGGYERIQPGGDPAGLGLEDVPRTPRTGLGGTDAGI